MDYYIGTVAKLMGMSVEGLRKYEKAGIINPKRSGDGEYRTYSYLDITSLIRGRMLRSFDFSLKEIEEMTNRMEAEEIAERLRQKHSYFTKEKEMLLARESFLKELTEDIKRIANDDGKVQIVAKPAYFRMEFSKNGEVTEDKETVRTFSAWMQFVPFVHISSRYHGETVYGGLAIEEKYARLFGLSREDVDVYPGFQSPDSICDESNQVTSEVSPYDFLKHPLYEDTIQKGISYIPAGLCLRIGTSEGDNGFSKVECADRLKAFADAHNFNISMNLIGHTIIGIHKNSAYQRYRDICAFFSY